MSNTNTTKMKILTVDIETRPSLSYIWSLWNETMGISQVVESGEMISWAAKWLDKKDVEFRSVFHDKRPKMIKRIWELLDEADAVVHWKGRTFDVPTINAEFLREGLLPPAPYAQIDLYEVAKKEFRFLSNKLDYVSGLLLADHKIEHEGFALWAGCMKNDPAKWATMKKYNIHDTVLTEKLYHKLLPWIQRHPSHGALSEADVCPNCGGSKLHRRGEAFYKTGKYQRFQCQDCGKWSRGTKRMSKTNIIEVGRL